MSNFEPNEKNGKGFAGLDSLVSDVSMVVENTAKPEVKSVSAPLPDRPWPGASPTQPKKISKRSRVPLGWITGGVLVVIIFISSFVNKAPSSVTGSEPLVDSTPALVSSLTASPDPSATSSEDASESDLETPPVGQNMSLNVRQIRYCKVVQIRVTAFESVITATNQKEIDLFNEIVSDYNSRCGAFRYKRGDLELVQRGLEARTDSISASAKSDWASNSLVLQGAAQTVSPNPDVPAQSEPRSEDPTPLSIEPVPKETLSSDEKASLESACSAQKSVNGPAAYKQCLSEKKSALISAPRNVDLSSLNSEENTSIKSACSAQKSVNGPAAYNQCLSEKMSALTSGTRNVDLSELNYEENASIKSACSAQKSVNGPAAYNQCLSEKLFGLTSGPRNIDLSGLNNEENASIKSACSAQKSVNGPAAYNQCLSEKISALLSGPRNVDLAILNNEEKLAIKSACSAQKSVNGPAAYNQCLSEKIAALISRPRNIDLSSLNYDEKASVKSACSAQNSVNGPAAYNQCLTEKMSQLKR